MHILSTSFKLLTYLGCWRPISYRTTYKKLIYGLFTTFISFMICSFTLTQILDLILNVESTDDFAENFYMSLAMLESACKLFCLLANRAGIIALIDLLTGEPCKSMDDEETQIQTKCERIARSNTMCYLILLESSIAYDIVASIMTDLKNESLTYRAWLPFNYSSVGTYRIVYLHQMFSLTIASLVHVSVDSLFFGLLMHLYYQIEILECRLKKITNCCVDTLKICARHHDLIYQFATMLNETFKTIIFSQFSMSTFAVCFTLYQLTSVPMLSVPFMQITIYICCVFTQIFFYCWFGNEVRIKSYELSDNIFATDWTTLGASDKRSLLLIMKRTVAPIEFTSAKIINMTLDSFVNLLKTSYSVFNVLQQTKQRGS